MSQNEENACEGEELPDTNGIYMSVFFFNIICLQIFLKTEYVGLVKI
jgi:hypothetical protein